MENFNRHALGTPSERHLRGRGSVLECGSLLPLSIVVWYEQRQRAGAVQNLAAIRTHHGLETSLPSRFLAREKRRGFTDFMARLQFAPGGLGQFIGRAGQTELRVNLCRRAGQEWPEQDRQHAAALGKIV